MTLIKCFTPLFLLFSILVGLSFAQKVDLTIEPNAKGKDVVEAVLKKVKASRIFPQDDEFLLRIAYAETKFGDSPNTYSSDSSGGIWKLDKSALLETQDTVAHPSLTMIYYKIATKFGINWRAVRSDDLLKPLYSGLAGRLFLNTLPESIPATIKEQAEFWKKYYHKNGIGTVNTFIKDINEMQNSFVCYACIDICWVLDGSGSISSNDFKLALSFVRNITTNFHSDASRFCLILYSTYIDTIYSLDNRLSLTEMLSIIDNLYQPRGLTNTGGAISKAVDIFKAVYQRPGVPKNMLVITDGWSNYPTAGVQPGPTNAIKFNIITLAWGVGPDINKPELLEIANGEQDNVDDLKSYSQLLEFSHKYKTASCYLAQKPLMNTEVKDRLIQHEKRYYNFKVTSTGISVTIKQKTGQIIAYYSYTEPNPSSALHDGQFSGCNFIPGPGDESQVFIAVEGIEMDNNYNIFAQEK